MSDEREIQAAQIEAERLKHLANARPTPSVGDDEVARLAWEKNFTAVYDQKFRDEQAARQKEIEESQMRAFRATLPQPKSQAAIEAEATAKRALMTKWAEEAAREHAQRQAWVERQTRQQIAELQAELD